MTTILVVDDEPLIVDVLAEMLQDEGYEVLKAANGREALVAMNDPGADLVLMDIMMPGMNGHEAHRAMRAHPLGAAVPIVLMSAAVHPSRLDPGVTAFLAKPLDFDKLLSLIARLLDQS
jgi:CheY-like chemotaxis protein